MNERNRWRMDLHAPLSVLPQVRGNRIATHVLSCIVEHGTGGIEGLQESPRVSQGEAGVGKKLARCTYGIRRQQSSTTGEVGGGVGIVPHCTL